MLIKRRTFIQSGSLATASFMIPSFLKGMQSKVVAPKGNRSLVILQLSGGNDGLNTIIPVTNDIYYRERPRLAIKKQDALKLNTDAGLHPSLTGLKDLYDDGSLSILNNVGYPNPDRSHFRSMDIWHSASNSNEYINSGWLGRYLDAQCRGCERPTKALEIDDTLSLAMKGEEMKGIAFRDPRRLFNAAHDKYFKEISSNKAVHHEETVGYLYKTLSETVNSAGYIFEQSRIHPTKTTYPSTELGRSLKTISSLILSDIDTSVYYVSIGSFDTHAGQEGQQKRLFNEINEAISAFVKDLKSNNRYEDVLLMTFSEFGRRVAQNASGGTDHGTANNMMFIGGSLKEKGILNDLPDLTNLEDGDLKHTVDFKDVYATILKNWLHADDEQILHRKSNHLKFV
jgi:uncharacterized protein (DUF1501 family)